MDLVHEALADGRPVRILTVVDQWSRSSPVLEVASRMSGSTVGEALDRVLQDAPQPRSITVDHGTEVQSRALEDWAYRRGVQLDRRPHGSLGHLTPSEFVAQRQVMTTAEAAPV